MFQHPLSVISIRDLNLDALRFGVHRDLERLLRLLELERMRDHRLDAGQPVVGQQANDGRPGVGVAEEETDVDLAGEEKERAVSTRKV